MGSNSEIHWAHIEPRRKKAIRWSENNCLALCAKHHRWFDSRISSGRRWLFNTFPDKVAWLEEEIEGIPRSAQLFTLKIADMQELEQQLKDRLKELRND